MSIFLSVLKIGIPLILALLNVHQFLYSRNPKYYYFYMKVFKKWRDTTWSIHSNYTVSKDLNFFKAFEQSIDELFETKNKVVNLPNKKQYNFGNFSLLVLYDLDVSNSDKVNIDINFNPLNVTYKNATARLSELRKLFLSLERKINASKTHYNMDIQFTGVTNPFYGLMIQRLGEEHVNHFECTFNLSTLITKENGASNLSTNNKLRVYKQKITINESSFDVIEDVAKNILLMR